MLWYWRTVGPPGWMDLQSIHSRADGPPHPLAPGILEYMDSGPPTWMDHHCQIHHHALSNTLDPAYTINVLIWTGHFYRIQRQTPPATDPKTLGCKNILFQG